jgi:lysophospholipase L1-like esterase
LIYGTVLCLGDSLTFGARSEFVRGYPEELARMLSEHLSQEWTCLNHGINGETSIDILRRSFPVIQSFSSLPGAKLACLMAGINDSKKPDLPIELYKDNLRQIIRIFRRHDIKLLVGTLPPVNGVPMPCFDSIRSNEWIKSANQAIRGLCSEYGLVCVDFSNMGPYLIDGVHLNYDGYREMAYRWFEKIKGL